MSLDKLIRGGLIISGLLGSTAFFVACKGGDAAKEAQAKANQVKPYNVISLDRQSVTLFADYPATLQGIQDIDIRPKIDGYIEKVLVDEGQPVRAGQVLFTINNPQFAQDVNNTLSLIHI